ncbi:MAG TPA: N-acetylmuramoyl-L-alanine amidase [Bacillota bacterium]
MPGFSVWRIRGWRIPRTAWAALAAALLLVAGHWVDAAIDSSRQQAMAAFLNGRTIVIDPGHGGPDPGSMAASGLLEKDVVLDIGLRLRDLLQAAGAKVVMTREDDSDISGLPNASLRERWRAAHRKRLEIAEASNADAVISIHANAVPSPRWFGAQTFYSPNGGEASRRLAEHIQRELRHITGGTDRTISNHVEHYMLNRIRLPAVIVEVGFLSNPNEAELLGRPSYRQRLAWSIFVGLAHFLAEQATPPVTKPPQAHGP